MHVFLLGLVYAALILAVVIAVLLASSLTSYLSAKWSVKHLPGPTPSWPTGNVGLMTDKDGNPRMLHVLYEELVRMYGTPFVFFLGARPIVVVTDAAAAHEVMVSKFRAFHDRPSATIFSHGKRKAAILAGILLAKGSLWTSIRAASQPVFHSQSLEQYAAFMNSAADITMRTLAKKAATSEVFDITELLGELTLRVVFKCAFGVDLEPGAHQNDRILAAAKTLLNNSQFRSPWVRLGAMFPYTWRPAIEWLGAHAGASAALDGARDVLYAVNQQLAENYRAGHPELEPWPVDAELLGKGRGLRLLPEGAMPSEHSLLAAFMRARNKETGKLLEPWQVLQQGVTFVAAGYHTTALTMSFLMYLVSTHPEVENRLLEEIDANGRNVQPVYEDLGKWPYTRACILEALRLYPAAPLTVRVATEDATVAGRHIVKNTAVHICIHSMHRNPKAWPEPDVFKPQRFFDNPSLEKSDDFMAFGKGPHNCVGMRFAMEEALIVVIRAYQQCLFRLCPQHHPDGLLELKLGVTLTPKVGLFLKAIAR